MSYASKAGGALFRWTLSQLRYARALEQTAAHTAAAARAAAAVMDTPPLRNMQQGYL